MIKKKNSIILIFILAIISLGLISALFIEYGLNHKPCKLCLYQRIPYVIAIILIVRILFFEHYRKTILLILSIIFAISGVLAFYHFGIEKGFFSELSTCTTQSSLDGLSKEQILKELKQNNISCKNVDFKIIGLSLATINTIFSFILSFVFIKLFRNYKEV